MTDSYTLSDIAAVTNGGGNGNDFGGSWSSWIIIFLIFAIFGGFGGFGGRGFAGGMGGGAADNYVLASDFAQVERKLDTVNAGLCDGFYAMNTGMLNGFGNVTGAIQNCCCENRAAIADLKYTVAQGDCATGTAISNAARDIIDSQNANYRALHDEIVANRIEDKNAQITAQQQQIFALQLAASQAKQTNDIVNTVRPCPIPSYPTCNPWAGNYTTGCGCGCGA